MVRMPEARDSADTRLRDYLHAELADFVSCYEDKALANGEIDLFEYTRESFRYRLDALLEGREVKHIHRWDLPDWHPESTRYGGSPSDVFTLTVDDVLILEEPAPPPRPLPNRKERRAAGWRGPWNGDSRNGDGQAH